MTGFVTGVPRILLRLEGLLVFAVAVFIYAKLDNSWWLLAALFLAPDLFMVGYLVGTRTGATLYNAAHWYALPLVLIGYGFASASSQASAVGLIWVAHIGVDRALGYGLKYAEGFGASHLSENAPGLPGRRLSSKDG